MSSPVTRDKKYKNFIHQMLLNLYVSALDKSLLRLNIKGWRPCSIEPTAAQLWEDNHKVFQWGNNHNQSIWMNCLLNFNVLRWLIEPTKILLNRLSRRRNPLILTPPKNTRKAPPFPTKAYSTLSSQSVSVPMSPFLSLFSSTLSSIPAILVPTWLLVSSLRIGNH